MVDASLLATMAVTGALLLAVAYALTTTRYRHPTVHAQATGSNGSEAVFLRLDRLSTTPSAWFLTFLLVTFGALGPSVLLLVGEEPMANPLLYVAAALAAIGVFAGSYVTARSSGFETAASIFITSTVIGLAMLAGVVAYLAVY